MKIVAAVLVGLVLFVAWQLGVLGILVGVLAWVWRQAPLPMTVLYAAAVCGLSACFVYPRYRPGVVWTDVRPARRRRAGRVEGTKTRASNAVVPLPKITRRALLERRTAWHAEKAAAGECWQEYGLLFCTQGGTPIEPRALNRDFDKLRVRAGLPGVRLHGPETHRRQPAARPRDAPACRAGDRPAHRHRRHDDDLRPHEPRRHAPGAGRHRLG